MSDGWISIHRCLQTHWLWDDKPFSYGQAWVDLLLMVNHKEAKTLMDATLVTVPAGSVITSEMKLSERWGWSRHKTRTFLKLLESDGMIEKKSDNKKTAINIVNWPKYQLLSTAEGQQKDINGTSTGHQRDTNNNNKTMINNDNNNKRVFKRPSVEEVRAYCQERNSTVDPERFVAFYDSNGWKVGRNAMKDWKAAVRTWEQRHKEDNKRKESDFERSLRILEEATE